MGEYPTVRDQSCSGPQRVCYNLYRLLRESADVDVTLFRPLNLKGTVKHAIHLLAGNEDAGPCRCVFGLSVLSTLLSRAFDVVHFVTFPASITSAVFLRRLIRGKMVYTAHGCVCAERKMGYNHPWLYERAERELINEVDRLVVVSDSLRDVLSRSYSADLHAATVIPNGVQAEFLETLPSAGIERDIRSEYALPPDSEIVFMAGGTREVKGIPLLLEAFDRMDREGAFLLVSGPKGSQHHLLSNRPSERTRYLGNLDQARLRAVYAASDVYVQTSQYESFGLAPLEAMASGCPAVVFDTVGMSTLIEDGVSGFVVKYGDVTGLADRMTKLLDDHELRRQMGGHARSVAGSLSWERVAHEYIGLYRHLLHL